MKWAVVIEKGKDSYGGYVPDLPGIGVGGESPLEVKHRLAEAIEFYFEDHAGPLPELASTVDYVDVEVKQPSVRR